MDKDKLSVYDYTPRHGVKEFLSKSDWFKDAEYYTLEDEFNGYAVIRKCYLEIPKDARKIGVKGSVRFESDIPIGSYVFDEDSNEDELVFYYL
jgi:hypothetical protein